VATIDGQSVSLANVEARDLVTHSGSVGRDLCDNGL
jgi:hypothetical protein